MVENSWYLIGGCVIIILLACGYYYYTKRDTKASIQHETYYFCVYNEDDIKSCNHDSGIKPVDGANTLTLKILKDEYNDGKLYQVNKISKLLVGRHYQDMKEVDVLSNKDLGDMFEVVVKIK